MRYELWEEQQQQQQHSVWRRRALAAEPCHHRQTELQVFDWEVQAGPLSDLQVVLLLERWVQRQLDLVLLEPKPGRQLELDLE